MGQSSSLTPSYLLTPEDIQSLPLVPHYVYAVLSEHVYNEPDRHALPPGWSVLMTCADVGLEREGYYATAYINQRLRHCIIAERGTADALGLRAGIWMYFEEPTIQFSLAEQFSKLVRFRLRLAQDTAIHGAPDLTNDPTGASTAAHGSGVSVAASVATTTGSTIAASSSVVAPEEPYFVSYTGHSFGAVIAACRACSEHTYAITFESPGCKTFVEKTMAPFRADDVDLITYLRAPNPINTLKPHCGYLVQLPYVPESTEVPSSSPPATTATMKNNASPPAAAAGGKGATAGKPASQSTAAPAAPTTTASAAASSTLKSLLTPPANKLKLSFPSFPNPQDYLRNRFIAGIPELQQYLVKLEPLLKEMFEKTQQLHSIRSIVANFEKEDEPVGQDVVLRWPSHFMQFLEYYNITKAMEEPGNQNGNLYSAYESLLQRLYLTSQRPKSKIPIHFLSKDAQKLVRLWHSSGVSALNTSSSGGGGGGHGVRHPLRPIDMRVLASTSIHGENLQSSVLTAFQVKQYLSFVVARDNVKVFLDRYSLERYIAKL